MVRRHLVVAALAIALCTGCSNVANPNATSPAATQAGNSTSSTGGGACLLTLRQDADALALVVAVHANSPVGMPHSLGCLIGQAFERGVPVTVVGVQGTPQVLAKNEVVGAGSNNARHRSKLAVEARDRLFEMARASTPSTDGADLVAALAMARDAASAAQAHHAQLVVVDSGLSDTGAVRFTDAGMLTADAADIAREVMDGGHCPVNEGVHVDFVGLGYGVSPQSLLTPADRSVVTQAWLAVVQACHGTATAYPEPTEGVGPATSFKVNPVTPSDYRVPTPGDPVTLSGLSPLGFGHDEVVFKDQVAAGRLLDEVAAAMKAHPSWKLVATGTTANGYTKYPSLQALGQARADSVKAAVVARGIDSARITAVGLGYTANPVQHDAATAALNMRTILEFTT